MPADETARIAARVGSVIGEKYMLRRVLGVGGMGAVYEAVHAWTERRVAVKVMASDAAERPDLVARFRREARAATRVGHPNIVQVLDMGYDAAVDVLFIVYEYLDGESLAARLAREGAVPAREALELVVPVMGALVAAHRHGVIHRDLKPENVVLAREGAGELVPKVIDFGLAKLIAASRESQPLTRVGAVLGTVQFMAPEQLRGELDIGPQADVWAMGVVLYEVLSGRLPFDAAALGVLSAQILGGPIPRLDRRAPYVPRELADVVHRAIERDRAKRFRTMGEFLERVLDTPGLREEEWHRALARSHRSTPDLLPPDWTVDDAMDDGDTTLYGGGGRRSDPGGSTERDPVPPALVAAAVRDARAAAREPPPPVVPEPTIEPTPTERPSTRSHARRGLVVAVVAGLVGTCAITALVLAAARVDHPRIGSHSIRADAPRASATTSAGPTVHAPESPGAPFATSGAAAPSSVGASAVVVPSEGMRETVEVPPSTVAGASASPATRSRRARRNEAADASHAQGAGALRVGSVPWCTVSIDGRPRGQTPVVVSAITSGDHLVVCRSATHESQSARVMVRAGELTPVQFNFAPRRPLSRNGAPILEQ